MRRDPKKSGTDVRWAKRVARTHGRDVGRIAQKAEFLQNVLQAQQRRAQQKVAAAQEEMARQQQIIDSTIQRRQADLAMLRTQWYRQQYENLMKAIQQRTQQEIESKRQQYLNTLRALEGITYGPQEE